MRSLRILLTEIIDYAGLFPPASLRMLPAVQNYANYRTGENSWALARFIVPTSRLDEFRAVADPFLPRKGGEPWQLSCLCSGSDDDFSAIQAFNRDHATDSSQGRVIVDMVEGKANSRAEIEKLASQRGDLKMFVEIPIQNDPTEFIGTMKRNRVSAKVRTGGITSEAFPSSVDLARFIVRCVEHDVEFKATAGLHHPLRSLYKLTYEPGSASGKMFGFLNVFLATALARKGVSQTEIARLLEEEDHRSFSFDDEGISWSTYLFERGELKSLRQSGASSFGSCSFTEPIEDINALGLL